LIFTNGTRFAKQSGERSFAAFKPSKIYGGNNMIVKIYAVVWVLGLMAAGICYLTGNLNPIVRIVFGFLTFGTIFMGMLSVLPSVLTHHSPPRN
jgi:hypothetical protein